MKGTLIISMGVLVAMFSVPAQALEPFALYDNFHSKFINVEKWSGQESQTTPRVMLLENVRAIEWGSLRLLNRSYHTGGSQPVSLDRGDNQLRVTAPEGITALKASVKVNAVRSTSCPDTNYPTPTRARARLIGSFFNTIGPPYNGQQNDFLAYIIVQRLSDSADKPQVLKVFGEVIRCLDSSCFSSDSYQSKELGDIILGHWATIGMVWDKANKQFIFWLNRGPAVSIPYTLADTWAPGGPFKLIGVSQRFPYCPEPGREAFVDVDFENIFVNKSAIP